MKHSIIRGAGGSRSEQQATGGYEHTHTIEA
jgi:hypothetical protein